MAYKGGYQTKATTVDYDGLVSLYVNGKRKAEASRETVRKERSTQLQKLAEASAFDATNIAELDAIFNGTAQMGRDIVAIGHKANLMGEIGRSDANANYSAQLSDMNYLGKLAELKKKQFEDVEKGIKDGKYSEAMLDELSFAWFTPKGLGPVLRFPDGTERPAKKTIKPIAAQDELGRMKLSYEVSQEYLDENGQIQVRNQRRALSDVASTDQNIIAQVNEFDLSRDFLKLLGDREAPIIGGEVLQNNPYRGYMQTLSDGSIVYGGTVAQEQFEDLRNSVNLYTNTLSEKQIISVLYEHGGFTPLSNKQRSKQKRSSEAVNNIYQNQYDESGSPIKFNQDPLFIDIDEETGSYAINEDNRKFAQALVRDRIYKGMDIMREEVESGIIGGRTGSKSTDFGMTVLPMSTVENGRSNEYLVNNFDFGAEYYRDVVASELLVASSLSGGADVNQMKNVNDFLRFGYNKDASLYESNASSSSKLSTANNYFSDMAGSGIKDTKIVGAGLSNFKNLYPQAKYTSVAGYEINEVTGMIGVQTNSGFQVHFLGTADIADMKKQIASGGGNIGGTSTSDLIGLSVAKLPVVSKPLTDSELTSRWKERYNKDSDFRERADAIAESYNLRSGENPVPTTLGLAKIGPKKWWYDVLETYK